MKITAAEAIVRCLELEGIEIAFGISGSHYLALFNALKNSKIRFISVKHEGAAGFMALNYTKISQKPALILGTAGPGAMNLMNGVAELYKAGIPAVIITPLSSSMAFGKNALQEDSGWGNSYSVVDTIKNITQKSLLAHRPEKIPDLLRDIFRFGLSEKYGPIHMGVPSDYFEVIINFDPIQPKNYRYMSDERIEPNKILKTANHLLKSNKPVLVAGVRNLYPDSTRELNELSHKFKIPIILSHNLKGQFNEHSELFMGIIDLFGHKFAEKYLKEADCIISIGIDYNEFTTIRFDPELIKTKIHIGIDSQISELGRNYPLQLSISGSIKYNLEELCRILNKKRYVNDVNLSAVNIEKEKTNHFFYLSQKDETTPIKPQAALKKLSDCMDKEVLIFCDMVSSGFWAIRNLPIKEFKHYISATGFSMGQGVSGCIGGKLAAPDKTVISITGDGSFLMNGMEVSTAKQYNLQITWIVFKDDRYNMINFGQKLFYGDLDYCTQIANPNFQLLAESFDMFYAEINDISDIQQYYQDAIQANKSGRSSLLIINYDRDENLPIKPHSVKMIEDLRNKKTFKTSKEFMRAFKNILQENI